MRMLAPARWVVVLACSCTASAPPPNDATAVVVDPTPQRALPPAESVNGPAPPAVMVERSEPKGLQIEDIVLGHGAEAVRGSRILVNYLCTLTDGTMVDNSARTGQAFEFKLGGGMVIPGWEQGVEGMRVGGRRRLTIPPELAYGERGRPPVIPERATLIFDIELVGVR